MTGNLISELLLTWDLPHSYTEEIWVSVPSEIFKESKIYFAYAEELRSKILKDFTELELLLMKNS